MKLHKDMWIYADPHFYHRKILDFCPERSKAMSKRGFQNHEEWLFDCINSTVPTDDEILCLGDFAFKKIENSIQSIRPRQHIILGNHDRKAYAYVMHGVEVVQGIQIQFGDGRPYTRLYDDPLLSAIIWVVDGSVFCLSHYPILHMDEYTRRNKRIVHRIETIRNAIGEIIDPEEAYYIHGHLHNLVWDHPSSMCVSIDQLNDFRPVKLGNVMNILKSR